MIRIRMQTPLLIFVFVCFAALEYYLAAGAIVAILALLKAPRRVAAWVIVVGIGLAGLKLALASILSPMAGYTSFPFSSPAALRETLTMILTVEMFVVGRYVFPEYKLSEVRPALIIFIVFLNIIVHVLRDKTLLAPAVDNTEILSFYLIYLMISKTTSKYVVAVGLLLATSLSIRLGSSFITISFLILFTITILRFTSIRHITLPWRTVVGSLVLFFFVASRFAYMVNFRVEGNNGYDRATLAAAAYDVFFGPAFFTGTPIGFPIVPFDVVEKLGWSQYLETGSDFNPYALSFHNSFLYMATRFGASAFVFLGFALSLIPKRGKVSEVLFSAIPLLFMSTNVVVESARAGPGLGFVLGSLFAARLFRSSGKGDERSWSLAAPPAQ
jgi:hypothetical protein